jgi:hypothetical protein
MKNNKLLIVGVGILAVMGGVTFICPVVVPYYSALSTLLLSLVFVGGLVHYCHPHQRDFREVYREERNTHKAEIALLKKTITNLQTKHPER